MIEDPPRVGEPEAAPTGETVRQRLTRWLTLSERSFEELRRGLELSPGELEDALRHVEKSARRRGTHLHMVPPECRECGFDFPRRLGKHLHPPSRCPRCRSQRIEPPRFHLVTR